MMNVPLTNVAVLLLVAIARPNAVASRIQYDRRFENSISENAAAVVVVVDVDGNGGIESPSSEGYHEFPPPPDTVREGSLIAMQFSRDPHEDRDHLSMIVNGELHLSGLRYFPHSLSSSSSSSSEEDDDDAPTAVSYVDVYGDFCDYDPVLNKKAGPGMHATSSSIMGESEHCGEHRYSLPLHAVMAAIGEAEAESGGAGGEGRERAAARRLPLSGLIFHEGYSGAGLLSNALSTFDGVHVVSEHSALRDALDACDVVRNRYLVEDCNPEARDRLVLDVVTLLSRTRDTNLDKSYLKLSSGSSAYLPEFRGMFPDVPWAFVYRSDPEIALSKAMERRGRGPCIKTRRNPSNALRSKSHAHDVDLETMSNHEVCALHLSSLLDVAMEEHARTGTGMMISYDDDLSSNVDRVLGAILPYLGLGKEIEDDPELARSRVIAVMSKRSNHVGGGGNVVPDWIGMADVDVVAPEEVRAASATYLKDSTMALDDLARTSRGLVL
jgi:hypothetical protein